MLDNLSPEATFELLSLTVCRYGSSTVFFNEDGLLHRRFGPAIVWDDGTERWHLNGVIHREDGPAWTFASGKMYWFRNGFRVNSNDAGTEHA